MKDWTLVTGFDEVGRGSLAGPIVAVAATFVNQENLEIMSSPIKGLNDSKKFSNRNGRRRVFETLIRSPHLIEFGIGFSWVEEINKIGIDAANQEVFHQALENLQHEPDLLIVDGVNYVPSFQRKFQHVEPKADGKYYPVAAASILAKVIRDELMQELDSVWPQYGWKENFGYGTDSHCAALKQHGPCELHRKNFVRKILSRAA